LRIVPYVALIAMNYLPMFLGNYRVFPAFLGFIIEFLLGLLPLFVITTLYSWWFLHKTRNFTMGITVNAVLFAWISAATFPKLI